MIDKMAGRACAICLLMILSAPAAARADDAAPVAATHVSAPASNPARDVITRQLAAIERHDADAAFAFTTEHVREKYEDPVNFLAHLRYDFTPLYEHKDYSFLPASPASDSGTIIQKIELRSRRGEHAEAIFRVVRQPGGDWLIDSFAVMNGDEDSI
jgi:hypothetical protein